MGLVSDTKNWLRLLRAHTVILEAPMAFLGAAIGLGTVYDPRVGAWLLFGVLYHLVGYGMNSYVDWDKGFDKDDEQKQHHPLNTGDIKPETAKKVIYGMTGLLVVYMLVLVGINPPSVGLALLMVASGLVYNYFGKYISLKAIPISIAHTIVFFIPYYTYTQEVSVYMALATAAYFVHHIYQIAISGDIKDICQDEASLLQSLGASATEHRVRGVYVFEANNYVLLLTYILMIAEMFLAIGAILYTDQSLEVLFVASVLGALALVNTDQMIKPGLFIRNKRLSYISKREFFGYTMIHATAIKVIGWEAFGVMVVCMVVYLGIVSKFIWGNWLVPEV